MLHMDSSVIPSDLSNLLLQIVDTTSTVIYVKDTQFRYILVNHRYEQLFGVSRSEIAGKSDFDLFPDRIAAGFRVNDERVVDTEDVVECEEVAQHADGPHTYLSVKFPLQNAFGQVVAVAGISTDITDRIRARNELVKAEHEMRAARAVQMALYPKCDPTLSGFDISGVTHPSSLTSGDYYDYITNADGSLTVVVGDVSGHGLGPALQMVETRASLRTILAYEMELSKVLQRLNAVLANDLPDGMFVTLFALRIDPHRRVVSYSSAGHQANILFRSDDITRLNSTGMVLGALANSKYESSPEIPLHSGDLIILATDGIMEQMSVNQPGESKGELFGWGRTMESVRRNRHLSAEEILNQLCLDVRRFAAGSPQNDDVTAVVIKVL